MSNIITLSTQNKQITFQRAEDGYINATALCQNAGKQIGSYLRNTTTDAFLKELEADMQISITELVQIQRGGEPHLQGTWVHPQVAIHLSQWLSPKFAVQVSRWVNDWIVNKQVPQIAKPSSQEALYELAEGLLKEKALRIEAESKSIQLENTVQKKSQEIQVLGYEKEVVEKNLEIKTAEVKEKDVVIETQDNTIKAITNIQNSYCLRQAKSNLCVLESELKEYLLAKKWCQYLSNGECGKDKKNTMQATAYAIKNNFAKDANVENKAQQKFFKQFRITKHGMAFLIKNRNEIIKK
jgi:hypothetical protein